MHDFRSRKQPQASLKVLSCRELSMRLGVILGNHLGCVSEFLLGRCTVFGLHKSNASQSLLEETILKAQQPMASPMQQVSRDQQNTPTYQQQRC